MPKVTEAHRESRRRQILDGARTAFARHGYEGTTVPRLEAEIGLSRGAIFSYYPSKLDLFVALAEEGAKLLLEDPDEFTPERLAEFAASVLRAVLP